MRLTTLIILGTLVGCSGAPNTGREGDDPADPPSDAPYFDHAPARGPLGCAELTQLIIMDMPDGSTAYRQTTLPCVPFYRDTGDPPPDEGDKRKQLTGPDPDKKMVGDITYQKESFR